MVGGHAPEHIGQGRSMTWSAAASISPKLGHCMLTVCSRDWLTPPRTGRDGCLWGSSQGPGRRADFAAGESSKERRSNDSCPQGVGHRGRALPSGRVGSRRSHVGASTFSPAVPPTCHKQRSRAVSSGQPRSLRGSPLCWAHAVDLGWGRRPKLHGMQGVKACLELGKLLASRCPARPGPMAEAIRTPWSAASSGRPPPVRRPRACPDRPDHAAEC
jgi:hypothetical protein